MNITNQTTSVELDEIHKWGQDHALAEWQGILVSETVRGMRLVKRCRSHMAVAFSRTRDDINTLQINQNRVTF